MREIRFAWVCRNIHFNEIERVELTDTMLLDHSRPSWITSDNCEIIAKILPTGVLDKAGKEIWEGHIVKAWHCEIGLVIGVIKWDEEQASYYFEGSGIANMFLWCFEEFEIIGDVYRNPELLRDS